MSIADLKLELMIEATMDAAREGRGVRDHIYHKHVTDDFCGYVSKGPGFDEVWAEVPVARTQGLAFVSVLESRADPLRPRYATYVLKEFHPTT